MARPTPNSINGPISGEIGMAPITTATLFIARPSVAMAIARMSWSQ
ncbi:MAG: hypothetical protein IPL61_21970 [Myxococcales bacterium]|nr:hypothetical protein [Myxococcales bacterium]